MPGAAVRLETGASHARDIRPPTARDGRPIFYDDEPAARDGRRRGYNARMRFLRGRRLVVFVGPPVLPRLDQPGRQASARLVRPSEIRRVHTLGRVLGAGVRQRMVLDELERWVRGLSSAVQNT